MNRAILGGPQSPTHVRDVNADGTEIQNYEVGWCFVIDLWQMADCIITLQATTRIELFKNYFMYAFWGQEINLES